VVYAYLVFSISIWCYYINFITQKQQCIRSSEFRQVLCKIVVLCAVYNWTVDNVISWLSDHVELSQYAHAFTANSIEGRALPRYMLIVLLSFKICHVKNV